MARISSPVLPNVGELVLAQHRQIQRLATGIERTRDLPQLAPQLRELRALLLDHFLVEEGSDGFYDTVRATTPRLVGRIDRLQREHQAMLQAIDRLVEQSAGVVMLIDSVLAAARSLTQRIAIHEADEEAVLNESVNTDLGLGE